MYNRKGLLDLAEPGLAAAGVAVLCAVLMSVALTHLALPPVDPPRTWL